LAAPVFCPRCGFANTQGHRFCVNCGGPLVVPPPAAYAPAPPPYGYAVQAPPPAYAPPGVPPGAYPPPAYAPPGYWWPPPARAKAGTMIGDTVHVWATKFIDFFLMFLLFGLLNAAAYLSISFALTGVPLGSGGFGVPAVGSGPAALPVAVLSIAAGGIVSAVLGALFTGAASYMAIRAHRNSPVGLKAALSEGAKRLLSLLGAGILVGLLVLGLFLVPLAVILAGFVTLDFLLVGLGFLIWIVAAPLVIFLVLSLALYAPVIMVEGSSAVDSLRKSWAYMRGRRLSLFGAGIVIWLLAGVIGFVVGLGAFAFVLSRNVVIFIAGTYVTSVFATALSGSLLTILAAVTYSLIRADEDLKRQYPGYYRAPGQGGAPSAPTPPVFVPPSSPPPANPPPPPAGP
jgi:hypothetical protein